jgi:hypothetical protein
MLLFIWEEFSTIAVRGKTYGNVFGEMENEGISCVICS